MRKRRLHVAISDEEEDEEEKSRMTKGRRVQKEEQEKEKQVDEMEDMEELGEARGEKVEEQVVEDAKPIGEVVRVSGKGRRKKNHFNAFEFDGNQFELDDPVLLSPEETSQKPYVAIIKDITQDSENGVVVTGQWFYRPEEAEKKGGGSWQARDTRELFYSFHLDDVPAESVMHKCVVHFVPLHKQLPLRTQHPGFIVQRVYDTVERKLWKLTDKDYKEVNQSEIDSLVQKTRERIGELPDIEMEEPVAADQEDPQKAKRNLRRKILPSIDVSRNDDTTTMVKSNTPGSCPGDASEYYCFLSNFKALTGVSHRDKWLEKLLQGIKYLCNAKKSNSEDVKEASNLHSDKSLGTVNGSEDKEVNRLQADQKFLWPDDAIPAVTGLEKTANEALGSDFQKYNQKMRQLDFNLKNNQLLAKRLLNKELEPSIILNMSPAELKDGLTADERTTKEPERAESMQMTDARCSRCAERKVGVADVIHAGIGDRYQLECIACGYTWYASRDEISSLTIDTASVAGNVGTAPWATAKFDAVEKKLVSPRESEKPAADVFHKTTAAYMPVLENQRSFNRLKPEDGHTPPANPA